MLVIHEPRDDFFENALSFRVYDVVDDRLEDVVGVHLEHLAHNDVSRARACAQEVQHLTGTDGEVVQRVRR